MAAIALFALTLLLIGAALAIPTATHQAGRITDRDAPVLGAAVLAFGLGGMNLVFMIVFVVLGEIEGSTIVFGVMPLAGGVFGLRTALRPLSGSARVAHLLLAAALTLAGVPGYFTFLVALLTSIAIAALYISGLIPNPRGLWKVLDPRL
jgi:hypothetical protein